VAERSELSEGQEVRLFGLDRRGARPGWISKVGRTIVEIDHAGGYKPVRCYMDSQKQTGETYGYGVWFRTLDQVELENRELRALETLRQHGLGPLGWNHPRATLDVLEAAAEAVLKATEDL
jgi:hypothetical protein